MFKYQTLLMMGWLLTTYWQLLLRIQICETTFLGDNMQCLIKITSSFLKTLCIRLSLNHPIKIKYQFFTNLFNPIIFHVKSLPIFPKAQGLNQGMYKTSDTIFLHIFLKGSEPHTAISIISRSKLILRRGSYGQITGQITLGYIKGK